MTSERLPGKALKEICARPVVHHLLDRVFACKYVQRQNVVVCTTPDPSNDPLVEAVVATGAQVFRGSEDNIIDRLWKAANKFAFDAFLQIDGDDPCTDSMYMNLCVEALLREPDLGIAYGSGLPLGLASKAIRVSALQRIWDRHLSEQNDTGFIYYFTKTDLCKQQPIGPQKPEHVNIKARLTLDYDQDLAFFRALFDRLYQPGKVFGIDEIVGLLTAEPQLMDINSALNEQYWARTRAKVSLEYRDANGKLRKIVE